jgi:hypothetical protein
MVDPISTHFFMIGINGDVFFLVFFFGPFVPPIAEPDFFLSPSEDPG